MVSGSARQIFCRRAMIAFDSRVRFFTGCVETRAFAITARPHNIARTSADTRGTRNRAEPRAGTLAHALLWSPACPSSSASFNVVGSPHVTRRHTSSGSP